ncbi:MAG: 30S ribosome-binding factor RbfA [Acidimicrobiia bacterium]
MAPQRRRSRGPQFDNRRRVERTARLGETLREVIADELARLDDERLGFVTITTVDVDSEMRRAVVYYDSLQGEEGDAEVLEALGDHRKRMQTAIADQVRARRTPVLEFRPDETIRAAERIDEVLRRDARGSQ